MPFAFGRSCRIQSPASLSICWTADSTRKHCSYFNPWLLNLVLFVRTNRKSLLFQRTDKQRNCSRRRAPLESEQQSLLVQSLHSATRKAPDAATGGLAEGPASYALSSIGAIRLRPGGEPRRMRGRRSLSARYRLTHCIDCTVRPDARCSQMPHKASDFT